MKALDSAQAEYAIFPNGFQGIAKDCSLTLQCGIGGIEHQGGLGLEQSHRHPLSGITLDKGVGDTGPDNPIHPALEDSWRHSPPIGMDNDEPVGIGYFGAMVGNGRRQQCLSGNFVTG